MLAQSKSMNSAWSSARGAGGGAGCIMFQGAKKSPAEGKELDALVANAVKYILTTKTCKNAKTSSDSGSEDEQEHFNF